MPPLRAIVAPGKILLLGEYAVLDGAPALVLAIHRGVRCTVWPVDPPGPRRIETPVDDRFAAAALDAVDAPAARYVFTDEHPVGLRGKPGFGGSAAATVAAVLAGGGRGPEAFEVHRRVQGSGSGVDVAASLHGGLVRFEAGVARSLAPPWPEPAVIFSGAPASTGPRVAAYRAWIGDRRGFLEGTSALVDAFRDDPVRVLGEARRLLGAMTRAAGIDWETPALARIGDLAEAVGGAAKPSGAGGGDCAVALLPDPEARRRFEAACRADGFQPIAVRPAGAAGPVPPDPSIGGSP